MKRLLLPLLIVAITVFDLSCAGSVEKRARGNLEDPARQAELRSTYRRELRLCQAFGERKELEKLPGGLSDPATISKERRALCTR